MLSLYICRLLGLMGRRYSMLKEIVLIIKFWINHSIQNLITQLIYIIHLISIQIIHLIFIKIIHLLIKTIHLIIIKIIHLIFRIIVKTVVIKNKQIKTLGTVL